MYKKKHEIIEKILLNFPRLSNILYRYFFKNRLGKFLKVFQKKVSLDYVYDIGAYKGEWSEFYSKTSLSNSKFILFEANKAHHKILDKKNFEFFNVILSDKKKTVNFFNNNNSTGDSYYRENTFHHKNLKSKKVPAITLDYIKNKKKLPNPDLIKIDTQGSEIDVLKGAKNTIKRCKLIYLECPIAKSNNNNLNFDYYLNYMKKINYIPQEICEIHHFHGFLFQIDILFMRKDLYKKYNFNNKLLKNIF